VIYSGGTQHGRQDNINRILPSSCPQMLESTISHLDVTQNWLWKEMKSFDDAQSAENREGLGR
jgi:hypothetical protein